MKTILFLRHAKSDWSNPELSDFHRPLTKRGMKDAPRMGKVIRSYNCVPDIIISSPAIRARITAELAAEACGYQNQVEFRDALYYGTEKDIVEILKKLPDSIGSPMIVSHNPALEQAVACFLSFDRTCAEHITDASAVICFPTAAVICFHADVSRWTALSPQKCTLYWMVIPRLIKAIT
jgi:phosphohistidine phosphatase